ncbi:MAG: hypothetical protein HYZ44_10155, partial [Bacteroidetes bacterium]|nr:hypothetical protein [Bacteroidota bacterium]
EGNTGTNPLFNFIGTTDAQDFITKTNSQERMRITRAGKVRISDLSSGGSRIVVSDSTTNGTLGTRTLAQLVDSIFIHTVDSGLIKDPGFINHIDSLIVAVGDTTFWTLDGNAGTNPLFNFIGTTDAQDFVTKTNSQERMRITSAGKVKISDLTSTGSRVVVSDSTTNGTLGTTTLDKLVDSIFVHVIDSALISDSNFIHHIDSIIHMVGDTVFWSLEGNAGTNPSVNFIGTTDAQDLVTKTNNQERMRITSAGKVRISDLSSGGSRVVVSDSTLNGTLGTRTLAELVDSIFIHTVDSGLINDSGFVYHIDSLIHVVGDTTFWTLDGNAGTNPLFNFIGTTDAQDFVTKTNNQERMRITSAGKVKISDLTSTGSRIVVSDSTLNGTLGTRLLSQLVDSAFIHAIDSALIRDSSFLYHIDSLVHVVGDTTFWTLRGNVGTNPAVNFLGTKDAQGLSIRTNDTTRIRIDVTGNVGIGNTLPTEKLDVTGNVKFSGELKPNGNAGTVGQVLTSQGIGAAPQWTDPNDVVKSLTGTIAVPFGSTSLIVPNINVTANSRILVTYEDPGETGFVVVMLSTKVAGVNFKVLFSGPVPSANAQLHYIIINP